jgi:glutamine---fructose-6-phosphate transaminase (isomerizing)
VHDGIVNNANVLRKELEDLGHQFTSETDTEVVGGKVDSSYLRCGAQEIVKGRNHRSLILSKDNPDEMVAAYNGFPLVIGLGKRATYVVPEPSAFNRYTKEFISMKDGEIGVSPR